MFRRVSQTPGGKATREISSLRKRLCARKATGCRHPHSRRQAMTHTADGQTAPAWTSAPEMATPASVGKGIMHVNPVLQSASSVTANIQPADTSSSGTSGSASITANDFLSLLVAEMKNQDPTANSDPNQYINQLVQVNSLQQLIQI